MRKVELRSVIVGGIVDKFASSLFASVSVVFVLLLLSIARTPADQVNGAVNATIHGSPWFMGAQVVIGGSCSLLGGYIAARLARHDERLNGALSSFISVGTGIVLIVLGHDPEQLVLQILMLPFKTALGLAGGYLREIQKRRAESFYFEQPQLLQ